MTNTNNMDVVSASFSDDYTFLNFDFTEEFEAADDIYDCSRIFDSETLTVLGSEPICTFSDLRQLQVFPDKDGSININQSIVLENRSLKLLDNSKRNFSRTNLTLKGSVKNPTMKPIPVLLHQNSLGICMKEYLYISGDFSKNKGYGEMRYEWSLQLAQGSSLNSSNVNANSSNVNANSSNVNLNSSTGDSSLVSLGSYFGNLPRNTSSFKFPARLIGYNETHSISVKMTNVLSNDAQSAVVITKPAINKKPYAKILGEPVIKVSSNDYTTLIADIIVANCEWDINEVSYQWEVNMTSENVTTMAKEMLNQKTLTFKPGILTGGYTYKVTASITYTDSGNQTLSSNDSIAIKVLKVPLMAVISGGDRSVGENQILYLDGSSSFDPEQSAESARYTWSCINFENGTSCLKKDGNSDLELGNTSRIEVNLTEGGFRVNEK